MESGNPAHQQVNEQGCLVPAARTIERALLPYERQLIDLLGCSVEEYKNFVQEAEKRSRIRPAEYDLVPDINNEASLIVAIVSLVVGVASSALSIILRPKITPPTANQGRGGTITLAGRQGADRFAQTFGFDSVADVAQYGDPIPIIWTKYTGETGGVLVSPRLVWSRLFSGGSQQSAKLLFVVGEAGVSAPDLAGLYIGNNGLDTVAANNFAFWWNNNGRIERSNLLYGTQGGPQAGDQQPQSDVLFNPAGTGAFAHAFTPSNNTQFGISNSIPNGTQYRPNWRIISIPDSLEMKDQLRRDRGKISGYGYFADSAGNFWQVGVGLNYPRRLGIDGPNKTTISASVGTTVQFIISGTTLRDYLFGGDPAVEKPEQLGGGETTDIDNALNSECAAADDALQLGEDIMIGGSIWRVTGRSLGTWRPGNTQVITLQCTEVVDDNRVGIPGRNYFNSQEFIVRNDGDNIPAEQAKVIGLNYWPLSRVNTAIIKNTRPCDITQINIRSNVWGRFNGLCNFNTLPTANQIAIWDSQDVSVTTGTMTEYFQRTSIFTIHYRELGATSWSRSNEYFCIRGSTPADQFRQIGIKHKTRRALEFRLIPIPSAVTSRFSDSTVIYWLSGTSSFSLDVGGVIISGGGQAIAISELESNPQMVAFGKVKPATTVTTGKVTSMVYDLSFADSPESEFQAWMTGLTGLQPDLNFLPIGNQYFTPSITAYKDQTNPLDDRQVTFRVSARVTAAANGRRIWDRTSVNVSIQSSFSSKTLWSTINTTGGPVYVNYGFTTTKNYQFGVNFIPAGTFVNRRFIVDNVSTTTTTTPGGQAPNRVFEYTTQLAEVSYYGSLITRSCDSAPEHQVVSVNEYVAADPDLLPTYANLTTTGIAIRSARNLNGIDQLRCWISSGINNSNSFPQLVQYLLERSNAVSNQLIDTASIAAAHSYTQSRGLFFDGAISESVNLRSFIADTAPFFLLNFVIGNGKFSLAPALPDTANVPISNIFTAGNIIEGSFSVEYLAADQRRDFQALMTYRTHAKNELPVLRTYLARFSDVPTSAPIESFDMSAYCTSRNHAVQVARYLLTTRRRITHAVRFKTVPEGSGIAPGSYIKIALQQGVQSGAFSNGIIDGTGKITSPTPLADGTYNIVYYTSGMEDIDEATLTITDGFTTDTALFNSIFSLASTEVNTSVYFVEQVELDEEGLVNVVATEFPAAQILSDMSGANITESDG